MTTDDGSSQSQATVHNGVRMDLVQKDARALQITINAAVIRPWVILNYGPDAPVPNFEFIAEPPEDLVGFTNAVLPWVQHAGLKIEASVVRDKFGIPEPQTGAEILEPVRAPAPGGPEDPDDPEDEAEDPDEAEAEAEDQDPNLNFTGSLTADLLSRADVTMAPYVAVLSEAAARAGTYEELVAALPAIRKRFDSNRFVQELSTETLIARGLAASGVEDTDAGLE